MEGETDRQAGRQTDTNIIVSESKKIQQRDRHESRRIEGETDIDLSFLLRAKRNECRENKNEMQYSIW